MGDPQGSGLGGQSIFGVLGGSRYFPAEHNNGLRHTERGTVSMAVTQQQSRGQDGVCGSQFFITLKDGLDTLDGRHTVFGRVVEGLDLLDQINVMLCDAGGRPLKDVLLRHTIILDDPFDDPLELQVPPGSPLLPTEEQMRDMRIEAGEDVHRVPIADENEQRRREARAQALTLEMIGDLPYADIKPAENVLFVCKLNPLTEDDDLRTIFARFGEILSCEVIRDRETEVSLGYAFIEFGEKQACEEAYFKMDNVLVDDRRIHVDFSQSVGKYRGQWVNSSRDNKKEGKLVRRAGRYRNPDQREKNTEDGNFDMVFDVQDLGRQKHRQDDRRDHRYRSSSSSRWDAGRSRSPRRHRSDRR
ncbi:Peptidyl-prolyl cis-trans isomerase-like 4 [Coemansia erecta]|uniref:Peptidyl-prolyl cis-trans isomerase n=1 Tax=Coemansia asiatica TaxID=1052880 RepID=A0A9W8CI47_9FUNG|nr:Peptidyl-prolyl cis-trans isomerase-like 4 [Coemansia asiatica]KAJ2855774.1 Peptidyl-prolyl cis-trans isomerase-like 4 [Coemansia erecta]